MVPALPLPELGLSVSQVALSLAVQARVPPPVLLRAMVWVAGLPPPWVAVNEMLVGFAPIAGAAVTVRVTGTDTVVVPGALKVIMPLYVPTANVPTTALTDTVLLPLP